MAASSPSVFLLGITGYIGGAVAVSLKKKFPSWQYNVFLRSKKDLKIVESLGFKPLIGSGEFEADRKLLENAAGSADIVINCVDADDLDLTEALLDALNRSSRKLPIYIHTSGTGVVADSPTGEWQPAAEKIWDDAIVDDIKSIPASQPHRPVDLAIFENASKNLVISYIVSPSTIYGVAFDNPVHKISQQVPGLIRNAISARQAVYGGKGTNVWNNVHILDMADLYVLVIERAIKEASTGEFPRTDPYSRFYWASAREHRWGDVVRALAPILHRKGLVDSPEARSVPANQVAGSVATNSRTVANRGFKDGWKPSRAPLEEYLAEDIEGVLAETKGCSQPRERS